MCVSVCVHECVCVCVYVCMNVHMHVCVETSCLIGENHAENFPKIYMDDWLFHSLHVANVHCIH